MKAKKSVWLAAIGGLAVVVLSAPAQAGACCFDDGSCQDLLGVECTTSGGSYQGDVTDCASTDCAGACYFFPDSVCLDDTWPDLCGALGGVYAGFGTDCQTLLAMATGACCYYDGSCNLICEEVSDTICDAVGGIFQGEGTLCNEITCVDFGACCFPDQSCEDRLTESECVAAGGAYQGDCTDCEGVVCPYFLRGACCFTDGTCDDELTEQECEDDLGGLYQGFLTECASTVCLGACCFEIGGDCQPDYTAADCVVDGGYFQGYGTICNPPTNECPAEAQCQTYSFDQGDLTETTLQFNEFDDHGGLRLLEKVKVTIDASVHAFLLLTNISQQDADPCVNVTEQVFLQEFPTITPPPQVLIDEFTEECCPPPGYQLPPGETCDFGGVMSWPDVWPVEVYFEITDPGDLQVFIGNGQFDAVIRGFGEIQWVGSLFTLTNLLHRVEGAICVTYEYGLAGACCFCDGSCQVLTQEECDALSDPSNDPWSYDWHEGLTCDQVTCDPVGACCLCDGQCDDGLSEQECDDWAAGQGLWVQSWSECLTCAEITCDPIGACCFCDKTCQDDLTQVECENAGGEYQGDCTTCADVVCDGWGACCLCDGQCADDLSEQECEDWAAGQGLWVQAWYECLTCADITCDPVGACCLCDGQCDDDLTQIECDAWAAGQGLWVQGWYECEKCADITCDPVGACCLCDGQCDDDLTQIECDDWATGQGLWVQAWYECLTCADITCDPVGACCLCDGQCADNLSEQECDDWAAGQGLWVQEWYECLTCADITCDPIGVCCLCDETCLDDVTEAECLAQGGQYQGDCTDCATIICEGWGACCFCDQTCQDDLTQAECEALEGVYQGDCTECGDVDCPGWGACCLCDGQCADDLSESECEDWAAGQGLWVQAWYECLTCADITCEPVGACCFCDQTCQDDLTQQECINAGGEYQGDCTTCADVICDGWGACCLCDGQCADDLSESECEDWAAGQGLWVQEWYECLTCADITCDPIGACCFCDKTCQEDLTQVECETAGGEYQGDCTTCADVECPGWGACCFCDGSCIPDITKEECESYEDSFYAGDCTDCNDCPPFGACCFCDETCEDCVTEIQCDNLGGRFQGAGTLCEDVVCEGWGACCFPDDSCIEDLTEQECLNQGGVYPGDCEGCEVCAGVGGCIEKGSLVFFSKVEIRWDYMGYLIQDTFLSLTNDYPDDVWVQMYFINGDPPLDGDEGERPHPGWNWVDNKIHLTANQPIYWSALTGQPSNVSPFTVLDPGDPPGRPAMDGTDDRVLRGYVVAWAVTQDGSDEIMWNHLAGNGTLIHYGGGSGWEYKACAFQVVQSGIFHGQTTGTPGELFLDGSEYGKCSDLLLMNFQAVGSSAFSAEGAAQVISNTDLTLHPVTADLRQNNDGPTATKADIDIWNQWEAHFSGHRCIACWDQTLLEFYGIPNHFLLQNLQTDHGKARINGVANELCNLDLDNDGVDDVISQPAALLGLVAKLLTIDGGAEYSSAGTSLFGLGGQNAKIKYDAQDGGPPPAPPLPPDPTKEDLQDFVDQILQQIKKGGSD